MIADQLVRETARLVVERFLSRFEPNDREVYQTLLYYAAVPLVLTPELLHYLRIRFSRETPWVAETDILLDDRICKVKGREQYAMHTHVRDYLLRTGRNKVNFIRAAGWLLQYIHLMEIEKDIINPQALEAQKLAAMAFIPQIRKQAVQRLADRIEAAVRQSGMRGVDTQDEIRRIAYITELMSTELQDHKEYEGLLEFSRQIGLLNLDHDGSIFRMLQESGELDKELLVSGEVIPTVGQALGITPAPDFGSVEIDESDLETQTLTGHVFISYAREDKSFVDELRERLKSWGLETDIDFDAIEEGENWRRAIDRGRSQADIIVGIWSPNSRSASLQKEWRNWSRSKPMIALTIQETEGAAELDFLNYVIDFHNAPDRDYRLFYNKIAELLGAQVNYFAEKLTREMWTLFVDVSDIERLYQYILREAKSIDASIVVVNLYIIEQGYIRHLNSDGQEQIIDKTSVEWFAEPAIPQHAAVSQQTYVSNNTNRDPLFVSTENYVNIYSEIAVPILVNNSVLGVIDLASERPDTFTTSKVEAVELIANLTTQTIERIQTIRRLLNEARGDRLPLYQYIVELAQKLVHADTAHLFMLEGNHLNLVAGTSNTPLNFSIDRQQGVVGRVMRTAMSNLIHDVFLDPDYIQLDQITRSELAVPIMGSGEVLGVINLESPVVNAFTQEDLHRIEPIASLAGRIISRFSDQWTDNYLEKLRSEIEQLLSRTLLDFDTSSIDIQTEPAELDWSASSIFLYGEPGSGKTTLVLRKVLEAITRYRDGQADRLPILGQLATWTPERSAPRWSAADEIDDLLNNAIHWGKAVLFLDGVDEMPGERNRLSKFITSNNQIILTSRSIDDLGSSSYRFVQAKILPLTDEQIRNYLKRVNPSLYSVLTETIRLTDIVRTPWTLAQIAYLFHDQEEIGTYAIYAFLHELINILAASQAKFSDSSNTQQRLNDLRNRIRATTQLENIDVVDFVRNTIASFRIPSGIKVTYQHLEEGLIVRVNTPLFKAALMNILDNAIKSMSGDGELRIHVSGDEKFCVVRIADTGVGIPSEQMSNIFLKGFRTTNSLERRGTGIGLWVTKQIIEEYGGKIDLTSKVNSGTEFSITLPIANESVAKKSASDGDTKKRSIRILIAEDEPTWAKLLQDFLLASINSDTHIDIAMTTSEAINYLDTRFYHLLSTNINFSANDSFDRGGFEIIQHVQEKGLHQYLAVIVLSASVSANIMRELFRNYKVADVIDKATFDQREYVDRIKQIIQENRKLELEIAWASGTSSKQSVLGLRIDGVRVTRDSDLQESLTIELEDLLCSLFSDADRIVLRSLARGLSQNTNFLVQPYYSRSSSSSLDIGQSVVVTIEDVESAERTRQNYELYVQTYLPQIRASVLQKYARTLRLGGLVYSMVGAAANERFNTFTTFYSQTASPEKIGTVLKILFETIFGGWFQEVRLAQVNLSEEYGRRLNLSNRNLNTAFERLRETIFGTQNLRFKNLDVDESFSNPIIQLTEAKILINTYQSIIHGNLQSSNILMDSNDYPFVIDFQFSGTSHAFFDIAKLDTIIRYELLGEKVANLAKRYELEQIINQPDKYDDLDTIAGKLEKSDPDLEKAFRVSLSLRRIAGELVPQQTGNMQDYYVALIYHSLNTLRFNNLSRTQREHALLSASLLLSKIRNLLI